LKILQAHNYYQQAGGEDTVVAQEKELLEKNGHQVSTFYKQNDDIENLTKFKKLRMVKDSTWSKNTYKEVDRLLKNKKIDVCHVHNTLPLITPSIYYACKKNKVPVVQTLHNYRLICTNGLLMRDGQICEDCLGRSAYGAIAKKCYRNSAIQTYVVARMLQKNKHMGTWTNQVDAYLCLTEMAKQKFIDHGLPENKLKVKPNFFSIEPKAKNKKEHYLLYAGRVTQNKGLELIKKLANDISIKIKIAGDGEMVEEFRNIPTIELLGRKTHEETIDLALNAQAVLFPTTLYEGMPMTIIEAFALKTPIIATEIGASKSMIRNKETGLLFPLNSYPDFYNCVNFCLENPLKVNEIVKQAYQEYVDKYTPESNYKLLLSAYQDVIG